MFLKIRYIEKAYISSLDEKKNRMVKVKKKFDSARSAFKNFVMSLNMNLAKLL